MARPPLLPRVAWRLAPRLAAGRCRRRFPVPVVTASPEAEADRKIHAEARDLAVALRFDTLLHRVQGQMAERETTPMGVRPFELTLSALFSGVYACENAPTAAAAAVEPFRDWHRRRGENPDAAALTARALQILAGIHLGGDRAPDPVRRKAADQALDEAHGILEHVASSGQGRELWHRTRFRGATLECRDPAERQERFERFLAFDPGNAVTYFERSGQLLPHRGGSHAQVERFAREATERTGHLWGTALYTMIHMALAGQMTLDRTQADWGLVLDGFDDALDFLPPVPVINDFLRLAARFGRQDLVRELFAELPELRLDRWDDADEPVEVYAWAHDRAPWPYAPGARRAPPADPRPGAQADPAT